MPPLNIHQLLSILETGIEIVPAPYQEIAKKVGGSEAVLLEEIRRLKEQGLIRRFRGQINYRMLGRTACLVAASVSPDKLDRVIAAVNAVPAVSHHYLRDHQFNLWFTLQAESPAAIEHLLADLAARCGTEFFPLPARRFFKLDVRFLSHGSTPQRTAGSVSEQPMPIELNSVQKQVLNFLQDEFPLVPYPFAQLGGLDQSVCIQTTKQLLQKGILKRIAAVLNHYRLSCQVNAMFCVHAAEAEIERAGMVLASWPQVSHCYQRQTFPGWPYNLFAMVHFRSEEELNRWIEQVRSALNLSDFAVLRTLQELKKEPVRIEFI